jgi:hypothetical protein
VSVWFLILSVNWLALCLTYLVSVASTGLDQMELESELLA